MSKLLDLASSVEHKLILVENRLSEIKAALEVDSGDFKIIDELFEINAMLNRMIENKEHTMNKEESIKRFTEIIANMDRELKKLQAENKKLREDLRFCTLSLANFFPFKGYEDPLALPSGLDCTAYVTLSYHGDKDLLEKYSSVRNFLKELEGEE